MERVTFLVIGGAITAVLMCLAIAAGFGLHWVTGGGDSATETPIPTDAPTDISPPTATATDTPTPTPAATVVPTSTARSTFTPTPAP
jgi:hypothetical protein